MVSRVEDTVHGHIHITQPLRKGAEVELEDGAEVAVEWVTDRGLVRAPGRAEVLVGEEMKTFVLSLVGEPEIFQRREYVRAKTELPLEVRFEDGKQVVEATSIDLSGGGIRIQTAANKLPVGARVRVTIHLPSHPVQVDAKVLRHQGFLAVVLIFEEVEEADRQVIIRHVFERLRASVRNW